MGPILALQTSFDVSPGRSAVLVKARSTRAMARPVSGSVTVEAHVNGPNG